MTVYHYMMAFAAGLCLTWTWRKGQHFAMGTIALSQLPFWVGLLVFSSLGRSPFEANLVLDLSVGAIFVWLLYTFNEKWLAWCAMLFVTAGIVDVLSAVRYMIGTPFPHHMLAHEIIHYLALCVVMGREYVNRWDASLVAGLGRLRRDLADR